MEFPIDIVKKWVWQNSGDYGDMIGEDFQVLFPSGYFMLWILIPVYTRIGRATPWICYVLAVSMGLYFCIRIGVHDFEGSLRPRPDRKIHLKKFRVWSDAKAREAREPRNHPRITVTMVTFDCENMTIIAMVTHWYFVCYMIVKFHDK